MPFRVRLASHLTLCRSQPPSITRLVQGVCSMGSTNAFRNLPRPALSGFRDFWSLSNRNIGVGVNSNRRASLVLTSHSLKMIRRLKSLSESTTSFFPLTLGPLLRLSNDFTLCLVSIESRTVRPFILACMALPTSSALSALTASSGVLLNPVEKDTRVFLSRVPHRRHKSPDEE